MSFTILPNSFALIEYPRKDSMYRRDFSYLVRNLDGSEVKVTQHYNYYCPGHRKKYHALALTPSVKSEWLLRATYFEKIAHGIRLTPAELKTAKKAGNFLKYPLSTRTIVRQAPRAVVNATPVVTPPAASVALIAQNNSLKTQYKTISDQIARGNTTLATSRAEIARLTQELRRVQQEQAVIVQRLRSIGIQV